MKINYNGIVFDSELEVDYYKYLVEQQKSRIVATFTYHPTIPIDITKNNSYTPDFIVFYNDRIEIIETKGYNQFSFMKDNMIHNVMLSKSQEELKEWLYKNNIKLLGEVRPIIYKKIKYMKTFGWVDFDFKNPNTLSNKRREKIKELESEIKNLKEFKKNAMRYFGYVFKDTSKGKITKKQYEWIATFVNEIKEQLGKD